MVMRVEEGLVKAYNKKAVADLQIKPGDFITKVNGVSGDIKKIAAQALEDLDLEITIRRPMEFVIKLDKESSDAELGLNLDYIDLGMSLLIRDIHSDGLV